MLKRASQDQLQRLVEFLEKNPGIAKGCLRTQFAKHQTKQKWEKFASSVNALGQVKKNGTSWAKYWHEKKCALKKRYLQLFEAGEIIDTLNFSPTELRMLSTIGVENITNDKLSTNLSPSPKTELANQKRIESEQKNEVLDFLEDSHSDDSYAVYVPLYEEDGQKTSKRPHTQRIEQIEDRSPMEMQIEKMAEIECKRVEADLKSARALETIANALQTCANAHQQIANAIVELARKIPTPPS